MCLYGAVRILGIGDHPARTNPHLSSHWSSYFSISSFPIFIFTIPLIYVILYHPNSVSLEQTNLHLFHDWALPGIFLNNFTPKKDRISNKNLFAFNPEIYASKDSHCHTYEVVERYLLGQYSRVLTYPNISQINFKSHTSIPFVSYIQNYLIILNVLIMFPFISFHSLVIPKSLSYYQCPPVQKKSAAKSLQSLNNCRITTSLSITDPEHFYAVWLVCGVNWQ